MHPVQRILEAFAGAVDAQLGPGEKVFVNRTRTISAEQTPCIGITFGEDTQDSDNSQLADRFHSTLEILLTGYVTEKEEDTARLQLLDLRSKAHRAAVLSELPPSWWIEYGGAGAPQIEQQESIVGHLESRWLVHYQMNVADPEAA